MSGIVGSSHNIRGSGIVAKLGTDGQVFTSAGAGTKQTYEAAGGGAWNLISTFTSDGSDAAASFTSGLDSTYDVYCFMYQNIHPDTDNAFFAFNASIDGGSNYNVAKTSTLFYQHADEGNSDTSLAYNTSHDHAQGTGIQIIADEVGSDNDQSAVGWLYLFNPASTVFTKHWISVSQSSNASDYSRANYSNGYLNTTSAVDAIQFTFRDADEIAAGKIKLYGIS